MKNATSHQVGEDGGKYGYLWWIMGRNFEGFEGFAAMGAEGQCIYVLPQFNIVAAFTGYQIGETYEQIISEYILQFVEDRAPEWDEIPEDQTILEGEPFFYDVNTTETLGVKYSINNTVNFNITPEGIITNSLNLSVGVYPLEIRAYNTYYNTTTATINIIVISKSDTDPEPDPEDPMIPGFNLNMIFLMILCTTAILTIKRKKQK